MRSVRSRVTSYLARRVFGGTAARGSSSVRLSLLPRAALMPLERNGLDPVPELGRRRELTPVSRIKLPLGITAWLVTSYEDTKTVLGGTETFSNDFRHLADVVGFADEQDPGGLGFSDPPEHTRLRRALTPEFTGRRLSRLVPRVERIVEEQLDIVGSSAGPVDLVSTFALPVPSLSICELLGVPYEDRADFQRLSTARFDMSGRPDASISAMTDSLTYLRGIVEQQRKNPGEGLLGRLVVERGSDFTDQELASLADGLLTGGLETTASMLALGTVVLLRDPAAVAAVQGGPAALDRFVDELLRYLTVVQVSFPRFALRDVEIGGQRIAAGDAVVCSLSGSNRDPRLGPDMEHCVPDRGPVGHIAFGYGIHRCVGAELAKIELRAAFPALVGRFPDMRLAVEPERLAFRPRSIVHGMETLPVYLK